jgi:hypothetical protein
MRKQASQPTKAVKQDSRSGPNQSHSQREGWSAQDLGEESSYEGTTEIDRRLRRGDESVGDPDERDVAGVIPENEMPHRRDARHRSRTSRQSKPERKRA